MKNLLKITIPVTVFVFGFMFITNTYNVSPVPVNSEIKSVTKLEIPANVQSVLDKSCTMCHNSETKNTKGKLKLNFDNFSNGEYSTGKIVGKLRGIIKVLDKGSMPPSKFLSKYPDKALTAEETKLITDWAKEQGKLLTGE